MSWLLSVKFYVIACKRVANSFKKPCLTYSRHYSTKEPIIESHVSLVKCHFPRFPVDLSI